MPRSGVVVRATDTAAIVSSCVLTRDGNIRGDEIEATVAAGRPAQARHAQLGADASATRLRQDWLEGGVVVVVVPHVSGVGVRG